MARHLDWVNFLAVICIVTIARTSFGQHILGTYPTGGGPISLTVSGADANVAGLDFISRNGSLVPLPNGDPENFGRGADASPYTFFLSNTSNQVTYGNLGTTVTYQAGTTTQLSVGATANNDVGAAWGRGPNPVQIPLAAVDLNNGSALIGSYPERGGPVSVTALGGDFDIGFFDFQSESGQLVPFDVGAEPFAFFLSNTPNQIALGSLGTQLAIPENTTVTLPVGISGNATDVFGFTKESVTGDQTTISPFEIVSSSYAANGGDGSPPVIERTDLPNFGFPVVEPPKVEPIVPPMVEPPTIIPPDGASLIGTFPAEGGPISITATGGDVEAAGLDFQSESGGLIPSTAFPDAEADGFTFFLSNTPNQVTAGNLGTETTFAEGITTELSFGVAAGTDDVQAFWGDGPTPIAFPISPDGLLDNEDNLLGGGQNNSGGGGGIINPGPRPVLPGGGGIQNPSAVPEPSSLLVWMTLGLVAVFQRWKASVWIDRVHFAV